MIEKFLQLFRELLAINIGRSLCLPRVFQRCILSKSLRVHSSEECLYSARGLVEHISQLEPDVALSVQLQEAHDLGVHCIRVFAADVQEPRGRLGEGNPAGWVRLRQLFETINKNYQNTFSSNMMLSRTDNNTIYGML
ncbi:Hypothetical_protein [Hexamita inflata]|uniref:Hypothetical_protein n=1 Tax=Hexamita inflata TaxID=28002 RepID=A0AA86RFG0_9EUKA|nr:Hypothetical protein HINF_LOCUS65194 [Hexamita inflata]